MATAATTRLLPIGDVRITFIPDGLVLFQPTGIFPTTTEADWRTYPSFLNEQGLLVGSMGAFVVQ